AKDGYDIRTTLDVDIQDVCDDALREFFAQFSSVQEGCVIVMETATGAIRAMVNLKRDGLDISESYNYALLNAHEPGSVFKLVTTMAALNDGYIKTLSDTIPCFDGYWTYKGAKFKQQDKHTSIKNCPEQKITIRRGIQESSNHVFHYIAGTYYGENREKFIKRLENFHILDNFEDFDIQGVASPWVTSLESMGKKGNELSFPHLGMGYGTYITTLHISSCYNAIANNGRMMMPYLVQSIEKDGKVIERKDPKVLDVICSKAVADTLTNGLKEVTSPKRCATGGFDGTAYWAFYKAPYKMAGKTGTWFVGQGKFGYEIGGATENNRVFVGFFPADQPQYTILAGVHTSLARGNVEGSSCARVVRKVADWLWYSGVEYTKGGKTEIIMRQ
ncbi:MAG: hypothetical protein MJY62_04950, partial [Bacteroidales bacterium]|nr:hypothetical protein [Bacteroidales bacterium]